VGLSKQEAYALMRERLSRREDDPLWNWVPHAKQRPFIDAVLGNESYENWLFAANRSGKTDTGAWIVARIARFGFPGEKFYPTTGWVSSLDFPTSRDVIQPKLFDNGVARGMSHRPFIPQREIAEWRVSDQILVLKNGSIIGFKSADSGRLKYQGAEKHYIMFDEEHPMEIYDEAVIRVGGGSRLRIFGTCTLLPPEGQAGGVSWSFDRIIRPWQLGKGHAQVFTASVYDNPHIAKEEIARLESVYPEGSVARRVRLLGELLPGLSGSRAYTGFDRRINVVRFTEPIAYRRPLAWMWDFNVEPMVSIVGQREGRTFRVYKEFVLDEGNILEMVEWFRRTYPTHGAEIQIYGDATGKGRTAQTGQSDYATILNAMRTYPAPVRLKVPETNPLVRDRINAVNRACKTEDGEVLLLIDEAGAPELIKDMEQVLLDARGKVKKTTDRTDPYFRRTHLSDALGYWIAYEEPVTIQHEPTARIRAGRIPTPGYNFQYAPS
jgi:phage terminase large subunit-like protein